MNRIALTIYLGAFACSASAASPTMGGAMSHLLVTLFENQIYLSFESPSMSTVELRDYDESYSGSASVLNNTAYNSQFGWLANGFISLPPETGIFVRTINASPWLDVYSESGFNAILGTDDSADVWQWDGTMTHNWYATQMHGTHWAAYEVFVGDLAGNPLDAFGAGQIRLEFSNGDNRDGIQYPIDGVVGAVPAPSTGACLAIIAVCGSRRRR